MNVSSINNRTNFPSKKPAFGATIEMTEGAHNVINSLGYDFIHGLGEKSGEFKKMKIGDKDCHIIVDGNPGNDMVDPFLAVAVQSEGIISEMRRLPVYTKERKIISADDLLTSVKDSIMRVPEFKVFCEDYLKKIIGFINSKSN